MKYPICGGELIESLIRLSCKIINISALIYSLNGVKVLKEYKNC